MNSALKGCADYRYDSTSDKCYNCSVASGGSCTNSSKSGCADFKYDGSSKCYDCSIVTSGACIN